MTNLQTANLKTLVRYLSELPEDYEHFEMSVFNDDDMSGDTVETYGHCRTAACAVGHGPYAGIPLHDGEDFEDYSSRCFVTDRGSDEWVWCFSATWAKVDNTPHGAAKRIQYMLDRGVPAYFKQYRSYEKSIYTDGDTLRGY